ncbi:cyclic pyranopterin monophosphate synthase MoaC [soil metagenome]
MTDGARNAKKLSHVDATGRARMVDVTEKPETGRMARARGVIRMLPATVTAIRGNQTPKGDVLGVARVAGVLAAKRTAELIPLCHTLPLTDVDVALELDDELPGVRAEAVARTVGRTGVEMEAIIAVSIALVTVYDMAKAIDKTMIVGEIELVEKHGGTRL